MAASTLSLPQVTGESPLTAPMGAPWLVVQVTLGWWGHPGVMVVGHRRVMVVQVILGGRGGGINLWVMVVGSP